jgi:ABC-type glycerol-3-phosphate transport system permease component
MKVEKLILYAILILIAGMMLLPFYWMLVLATQSTTNIFKFPPPFWFGGNLLPNFAAMSESVPFLRAFFNSAFLAIASTSAVVFFCSLGGYAFAVYRFPGQKPLFAILLGTMMIPFTAGIIPWFFMMSKFGWVNNYLGLIVPGAANAFGIFWMRQYCQNNMPISLLEAAKIDGLSEWLMFFKIAAPILMPGMSALGIMSFVGNWNNFLTPLLLLRDPALRTLPLLLRYMAGDPVRGTDMGALMLANALAVLPLLIAFLAASRYFIASLTAGAVKE